MRTDKGSLIIEDLAGDATLEVVEIPASLGVSGFAVGCKSLGATTTVILSFDEAAELRDWLDERIP